MAKLDIEGTLEGTYSDTPDLEDKLRGLYPHGHPDFINMCLDEVALHSVKNRDYAQGGDPLGNFRRVAAILGQYELALERPEVVALVYALKQLDATLWMWSNNYEGEVESVDARLEDVGVYTKLARILYAEG